MKTEQHMPTKDLDLTTGEVRKAIIEYARRKGQPVPDKPEIQIYGRGGCAGDGGDGARLSWVVE